MASPPDASRRSGPLRVLHGAYYVVSGAWPIVHLRSFEAVTGPKADGWLAQTAGGLIAAIGVALLADRRPNRTLAIAGATTLAASSIVFVARGRISKVYLLDAAVEVGLAAAWVATA